MKKFEIFAKAVLDNGFKITNYENDDGHRYFIEDPISIKHLIVEVHLINKLFYVYRPDGVCNEVSTANEVFAIIREVNK